jgi:hypothetical protein
LRPTSAAFKIQRLGNQDRLPSREDIAAVAREFAIETAARRPVKRRA